MLNSTRDECVCVREGKREREREMVCQHSKKFVYFFPVKDEQIEFELLFCSGMRITIFLEQRLKIEMLSFR